MPKENEEIAGKFGGWSWRFDTKRQTTVIVAPDGVQEPYALPGIGNAEARGFCICLFLVGMGERSRAFNDVRTAINHSTIPPEIRQQVLALIPRE